MYVESIFSQNAGTVENPFAFAPTPYENAWSCKYSDLQDQAKVIFKELKLC
jgi:hypothetical protein